MARKKSPGSRGRGGADPAGRPGPPPGTPPGDARRDTQDAVRDISRQAEAEASAARREADAAREAAADLTASLVERAVGAVDDALQAHVAEHQRRADRAVRQADRAARHAAKLDRLAGYLAALDVWTRAEPGERKPRFTRDEIALAAIRIADEEGLEALSMRHLASELGAGTMTLYHYVRTKDELMTLVSDAIMGEVAFPPDEPLPDDWREAVAAVARRTRAVLQRHPWVLDIHDDPPFGPNGVRHFDQSMRAIASLDVDLRTRLDIVTMVDDWVFGHCLQERNATEGGGDPLPPEMRDYVVSLLATGDYPTIEALVAELGVDATIDAVSSHQEDPGRFERALARLLDGIEASLPEST